jgi:hypothetical protein
MTTATKLAFAWIFSGIVIALIGSLLVFPTSSEAQAPGNNAVFNSSASCVGGSPCAASTAFIDVSVLLAQGGDICDTIFGLFTGRTGYPPYPASGAVIDARGMPPSALACQHGSPWAESSSVNLPSTILLPAGTIVMNTPWVLPNNTRLIGEGGNISSGTTIQAPTGFSGAMIQMGAASVCPSSVCTGMAIEHLVLDGQGQNINGIVNQFSEDLSYVDHVSFYRVLGTGLTVAGSASYSGPYTNITFNTAGACTPTVSTKCIALEVPSTKGVRGLTCTSKPAGAAYGVLLDGSNNSIKDVSVDGFTDGILIGNNFNLASAILENIQSPGAVGVADLIHICGNDYSSDHCVRTVHTVTDLAILGASCSVCTTTSVKDDTTNTALSPTTDPQVAMYILGEPATGGVGNSRFTTSTSIPTWAVGSFTGTPTSPCAPGSLLSNTSGSGTALYVCKLGTWTFIK